MFHWICPECGREIAPQAKACPACEPEPALASAQAAEPEPQPAVHPLPGAVTAPQATRPGPRAWAPGEAQPVAQSHSAPAPPELRSGLAEPEPAAGSRIPHAPLRPPRPAKPLRSAAVELSLAEPSGSAAVQTALPPLAPAAQAEPRLAPPSDFVAVARQRMRARAGSSAPLGQHVNPHVSLPGPTLPHELTSLEAAGLARVLVARPAGAPGRQGSWFLSVAVASGLLAVALSAVFYALPGLAEPGRTTAPAPAAAAAQPAGFTPPPAPPPAEHPLVAALEVTGIRFVTDLPGRPPQIHYLVVNHSNTTVNGVVVTVLLRATATQEALTQFSFRTPALGPYESKEMVSAIQRIGPGVELPGWRTVKAEIRIEP